MPDFSQNALITTLHDLGTASRDQLEQMLYEAVRSYPIGLVLPVTAADMQAEPFDQIVQQLQGAEYLEQIVVVLGVAPEPDHYRQTRQKIAPLQDRGQILWTDGPRLKEIYACLTDAGMNISAPGKGRSVWTAFGYLLADSRLKAFALHDCDIVNYDRDVVARLCLPMAHSSLNFEFCKAYYARCTDRLHGRVVRLLVTPLLQALTMMSGHSRFVDYLSSFRYPLAGEFAVSSNLAQSNRVPSDWGLEIGTLAEVFRNTSVKRVCQVDLRLRYEHKHQPLSLEDPEKGLMKMASDVLLTLFRTLSSMGIVLQAGHFLTLRSAYLRCAQDAVRQYHADALMNHLYFDRQAEEQAVEGFARQIVTAGEAFRQDPSGERNLPNWARVLSALPDLPARLREAAAADAAEFS